MKPAVKIFDTVATLYTEKYFDVSEYAVSLEFLSTQLNEGNHICDLACGPSNISYHLKKKFEQLHVTGVDLAENMIKIAREKIPEGHFVVGDIISFVDHIPPKSYFNAIICGFGIPYLNLEEIKKLLQNCTGRLEQNGVLYMSFMQGTDHIEKVISNHNPEHFIFTHFHDPNTIGMAAKEKGFELIHIDQHEAPSKDVEMIFRLSH